MGASKAYGLHGFYSALLAIETRLLDGSVPPGQIICLSVDGLRTRLGDARWARASELVLSLVEKSLGELCGSDDIYFRCKDNAFLIVFANPDLGLAEGKVLHVARTVSRALFGTESELEGITLQSVTASSNGFEMGPARGADDVMLGMLSTAHHRDILDGDEDGQQGAAAIPVNSVAEEPSVLDGELTADVRSALMGQFQVLMEKPIRIGFWRVDNDFQTAEPCFWGRPMREGAFDCEPDLDYDVLGEDPSLRDIITLDIKLLEAALLTLSREVNSGSRVRVKFNLHFETLASRNGWLELATLLGSVPPVYRNLLIACVWRVPTGIPAGRMAELWQRLSRYVRDIALGVEGNRQDEIQALLRAAGRSTGGRVGTLVLINADDLTALGPTGALGLADQVRQAGLAVTLEGVRDSRFAADIRTRGHSVVQGPVVQGDHADFLADSAATRLVTSDSPTTF